ncbi:NADH:ubiquinone reductase (Na(+)-transporting) subunit F [Nitratireductor sp. StC3]|uniref:NADH:ubiquinone reductase (Na(+)-transporting) subunit F n=1 Tax=Nitratireductor sp. StC3 TaxID=2126741 RepID=UPI000D0D36F0|nr:NADH:ubiquinone reductase (Na(+)-transporting) subunit F [Nitratireductor sp. StC3]PSM16379.1 NADH:ubiquinone reductase (Na(+)-transporting) subunit F [Nitratireductor sp. StC3]
MNEIVLGAVLFVAVVLILSSIVVAARALLLPSVGVAVRVNGEKTLHGRAGMKLLEILTDGGVPVPAACGGKGTCGQCRVTVEQGAGAPAPTEAAKLTRREMREGVRLACQVSVRNDLDVGVADEIMGVESWVCRVLSTRMLSPLIREIVLELPSGKRLDFRAGAFVQVTAPAHDLRFAELDVAPAYRETWERLGLRALVSHSAGSTSRAYSIANRPQDTGRIVLLIRLALPPPTVDGAAPGIVSSWLFDRKPADEIAVAGPYGDFAARQTDREMVFIGGGVGMAPLRAMIFDQLQRLGTKRRMSFWYGARSRADLFYQDEFDALQADHANFSWTPALSEPAAGDAWKGATGFIHDVVLSDHLADHPAPEDCEYYLCGPPLMIKAVLAMLDEIGVDPDSIFFDDFGV